MRDRADPANRPGSRPGLAVTEVAGGLSNARDVGVLPDGRALVTERAGRIVLLSSARPGATVSPEPAA